MNKNEKQPAPRLRWKKDEPSRGLMRVIAGPTGSRLHDGKKTYANVSALRNYKPETGQWFWSAPSAPGIEYQNTCNAPYKTEADAKKAAMEYVKACFAKIKEVA